VPVLVRANGEAGINDGKSTASCVDSKRVRQGHWYIYQHAQYMQQDSKKHASDVLGADASSPQPPKLCCRRAETYMY